ncbi:hypothetical protein [Thiorhodovibrio frisius]|uniref:Uncharacterized protein n=1 Tax=Thiorhodovibrio frisius TaxID=631362 RepID=H8YWR4_9GAMM|nr:hypothetical protein [Thiorhodovibrio frisius]EIC22890.1 hypothetical protein Thi970DRAFT_00529 [Thiorhodovibrio frisius]
MSREKRTPWHELLGKALADALIGLPYRVSSEEELALRSQRLDVLIIEQGPSPEQTIAPPEERPDGLEDLAAHNLLSFKAGGEPFDVWAAEELNSHYVTYRKLASIRALRHLPAGDETPVAEPRKAYPLLPVEDFRSYAIATRFPRKLVKQLPPGSCQKTAKAGIYHLRVGTRDLRLVVINQLELHPRNAPWGLFATDEAHWRAAFRSYRPRSDLGAHLHNLIAHHRFGEGKMAHTYEDMKREARDWLKTYLPQLDPEERLEGLDPEARLKGLDSEARLKGLDPDVIEAWLKKQRSDH